MIADEEAHRLHQLDALQPYGAEVAPRSPRVRGPKRHAERRVLALMILLAADRLHVSVFFSILVGSTGTSPSPLAGVARESAGQPDLGQTSAHLRRGSR